MAARGDEHLRWRYLERARSARPLDAVFLVHYYNTQVRRDGMPDEPPAIDMRDVLAAVDPEWYRDARLRAERLLDSAFDVGAAFFGYQGAPPYDQQLASFRSENPGFCEQCYALAAEAAIRAMR